MGGNACSVCGHADRLAIETSLISGRSSRAIAAQWKLSKSSILRHKDHVRAVLHSGHAAVQSVHRASLFDRLDKMHGVLDEAEDIARRRAGGEDGDGADTLVKSAAARSRVVALEFGTRREVTHVDPKAEFDALLPDEKRERLAEAKARVLELEAEVTGGSH